MSNRTRTYRTCLAFLLVLCLPPAGVLPAGVLRAQGRGQIELPRLARTHGVSLRRVEPLDDSLESVFGYLVEQ